MEGKHDGYRRRLDVEAQQKGSLEALLGGLRSGLFDHTSLGGSVRGYLRQDVDCDLHVYLQAILASMRNHTAGFRFATWRVVKTPSVTHCQYFSSVLMPLDGCLAALPSEPSLTTSSDPLGHGEALPPS